MSREIDALVAEKVMGFSHDKIDLLKRLSKDNPNWEEDYPHEYCPFLPFYSTSIEAAWELYLHFIREGFNVLVGYCHVDKGYYSELDRGLNNFEVKECESAPMSIALVSLKAVGHER